MGGPVTAWHVLRTCFCLGAVSWSVSAFLMCSWSSCSALARSWYAMLACRPVAPRWRRASVGCVARTYKRRVQETMRKGRAQDAKGSRTRRKRVQDRNRPAQDAKGFREATAQGSAKDSSGSRQCVRLRLCVTLKEGKLKVPMRDRHVAEQPARSCSSKQVSFFLSLSLSLPSSCSSASPPFSLWSSLSLCFHLCCGFRSNAHSRAHSPVSPPHSTTPLPSSPSLSSSIVRRTRSIPLPVYVYVHVRPPAPMRLIAFS